MNNALTRMRRPGLVLGAAAAVLAGLALPALAGSHGSVSPTAAPGMPHLATSGRDGSVEQVRQLRQCGATMYAVGLFSSIQRGTSVYARNNAFSFNAATGAVSAWNPNVRGQVNSIALSANCATAYLGGAFTNIHGTVVKRIAAVSTKTGAVLPAFAHDANRKVESLVRTGSHLLVGGSFTTINGSNQSYLVSLNPATGRDDNYVNLTLAGHYSYTAANGAPAAPNATHVYNFALSPDATKLLVMGVFTSVSGHTRRQIFMADLRATGATLDPWYSREFDRHCGASRPFYVQDAAWAPGMGRIFVATTGYKPANGPGSRVRDPRGGLCDAVAAYPATSARQSRLWINYTGCDSLYAIATDAHSVYIGGHERFASNRYGCNDYLAPGATRISAQGMAGLTQGTGRVYTTSNPLLGKYVRGRGVGADDMLVTAAGLWIASDNAQNTNGCGRTATGAISHGHSGICFLPY